MLYNLKLKPKSLLGLVSQNHSLGVVTHNPIPNYIKLIFDTLYLFCCCPNRIKHVKGHPLHYVSYSWRPHIYLCGILTILNLIWVTGELRYGFYSRTRSPSSAFLTGLSIINTLEKIIAIKLFWLDYSKIISLVNHAISIDVPYRGSIFSKKPVYVCFLLTFVCVASLDTALGRGIGRSGTGIGFIPDGTLGWEFSQWWNTVKKYAKYNFFISTNPESENNDESKLVAVLGILTAFGWIHRRIFGAYCEALQFVAALTLWTAACGFSSLLETSINYQRKKRPIDKLKEKTIKTVILRDSVKTPITLEPLKWEAILRKYEAIKMLAEMINNTFGWNFTIFLIGGVLDYAIGFDWIILGGNTGKQPPEISKSLTIVFYFILYCTVLFLSAESCKKVNMLKQWLAIEENRRQVCLDHLYMIINELDTNSVSIKGNNVFPITYSLAASLGGITVTYFIICVQSQSV